MKDPDAETRERIDDLRAELARKDDEIAAIRNWCFYPSLERDAAMKRIRELEGELSACQYNLARAVEATQFAFDAVNVIDDLYCDAVDSQPGDNDAFDSLEGAIEVLSMRVQGVLRVLNVDPAETLEWSETRKSDSGDLARAVEALEFVRANTHPGGNKLIRDLHERARTVLQALKGSS